MTGDALLAHGHHCVAASASEMRQLLLQHVALVRVVEPCARAVQRRDFDVVDRQSPHGQRARERRNARRIAVKVVAERLRPRRGG